MCVRVSVDYDFDVVRCSNGPGQTCQTCQSLGSQRGKTRDFMRMRTLFVLKKPQISTVLDISSHAHAHAPLPERLVLPSTPHPNLFCRQCSRLGGERRMPLRAPSSSRAWWPRLL